MKILIKHGADARICDSDGQTALHKVQLKKNLWIILYLYHITPVLKS